MDTEDHDELGRSPVVAKSLKENDQTGSKKDRGLKNPEALGVEDSQGSSRSTPTSEAYSLKDYSWDGAPAKINQENVAEETEGSKRDQDEPHEDSDASFDISIRPEKEMVSSLKHDFPENSKNLEPVGDDNDSPSSETDELVKEVVSVSKKDKHKALVQGNEEIEVSIDSEPLMVANISPKSDTDDEVKKEVVVFESKKEEDHEGSVDSEDSEIREDPVLFPKVEMDITGSEDVFDDKTNHKTSSERPALDSGRVSLESVDDDRDLPANVLEQDQKMKGPSTEEKVQHPASEGRRVSEMSSINDKTAKSSDLHAVEGNVCPETAVAMKDIIRVANVGAATSDSCHHSGSNSGEDDKPMNNGDKGSNDCSKHTGIVGHSSKPSQRSFWRPLSSYFRFSQDTDQRVHNDEESMNEILPPIPTKGRILFYTRLGCRECKEGRRYLHAKRLRYVEINVDLYPGRKLELEKISGSPAVPKIFFNEILMGDVNDLKRQDEIGKLQEKIDYIFNEPPPREAPLPPLSGEDDISSSGSIDELAVVVRKMQDSIVVKDRFYKMRRIANCFLGSEAVDFISEDQYLQREEAVQFARKLANCLFLYSVLEENVFEDGNQLYRFLDHDPVVSTQCHNIPRGIIEVKPKPITEIASRLRFLSYAIFEAYVSEDGRHVDYRSIHGSEEFARYIRTVEQLQRVEVQGMTREERLAFFVNLYNMMAIHSILVLGHPTGALERRRFFTDFQYVVGGCTYSLSAIQNGILRGNQRPPYSLMKPFGARDKRLKVVLPYSEQLTHFALVCGTRSGPALRCYSPGNIDKELMDAARDFLQNGGFIYDATSNVASVTKILKWFSVDFGKTEVEVLKHATNYMKPADSEKLLDLLSANQLKVIYQPYNWGLNC
ncbi:hypothetical protein MLD38_004326 [Melastoma candidum]|uniref:Uncharacterized protein n=1 Tax=Melastoma candidum TaxID=119954 RepID=A0ACB9S8K0_9MYRT|nr:hypothetical protein MLD38_004326 [Melastoma candidum]